MLETILIGLDGSPYSRIAVDLGLRWAKRCDAMLVGIGVIEPPKSELVSPASRKNKELQESDSYLASRRKVEQFLEQFALQCAEAGVACKLLEQTGLSHDQIVAEATRYDLILLGRKTFFAEKPSEEIDETLHHVVKYSPRPVVTVTNNLPSGRGVLIAYDGSLQAAHALQAFQSLELHEAEDVHVLTVASTHAEATRHADRAAEFLRFHGIEAQRHCVDSTAAPAGILLDQIRQHNPRLVVMGAYGQPAWREFVFGSVTQALLKKCPAPLLLCQ